MEAGGGTANSVYTENFGDVQLAAEAAQSFIDNGHAVLTGTAQMTVGAIGVARENDIPWFGTQSNQTTVGPEIVVANQVYKWDVVLDDLVADIQAGTYGGSSYEINFANGGLVIEYNDAYDLPADVRAVADAAVASFMNVEPLRAAVVTPSAENDLAFSQSIVDALHRMEAAGLLSEVAVSPGLFIVEDAGLALRDYAEDGFDLVIAHGSQYGGLLEAIAPRLPRHRLRVGHLGGDLRPVQHLGLHHLLRPGRLRHGSRRCGDRRRFPGGGHRPDRGRRRQAVRGRVHAPVWRLEAAPPTPSTPTPSPTCSWPRRPPSRSSTTAMPCSPAPPR